MAHVARPLTADWHRTTSRPGSSGRSAAWSACHVDRQSTTIAQGLTSFVDAMVLRRLAPLNGAAMSVLAEQAPAGAASQAELRLAEQLQRTVRGAVVGVLHVVMRVS